MPRRVDRQLVGERFFLWSVIAHAVPRNYQRHWLCRCECGTEKVVREDHLLRRSTQSCGCRRKEVTAACKRTHGMRDTPTYLSWLALRNRCQNPKNNRYKTYGARGIKVCERWASFENFLSDMGERPEGRTIDRIDCDGDYEPNNCRWATRQEQDANRRPYGPRRKAA